MHNSKTNPTKDNLITLKNGITIEINRERLIWSIEVNELKDVREALDFLIEGYGFYYLFGENKHEVKVSGTVLDFNTRETVELKIEDVVYCTYDDDYNLVRVYLVGYRCLLFGEFVGAVTVSLIVYVEDTEKSND